MSNENPVELFDLYIAHIGLNAGTAEEAEQIVEFFSTFMGLERNVTAAASVFAGTLVEVMLPEFARGEKGHIGFHVNDLAAAEKWFGERGYEINDDARAYNADGSLRLVYFKEPVAGFAIHLTSDK